MGCRNSIIKRKESFGETTERRSSGSSSSRRKSKDPPPFTERQKGLVLTSWKILQADIAKVGVVIFMRLFEKNPGTQEIFIPFKGMSQDELQNSKRLRDHGLLVMRTVEKLIARFDDPPRMEKILSDLGQKHVMFNVKVDYLDLIGPNFILAIRRSLGDQLSIEMEEAWSDFFKLISFLMKESMVF